MRAPSVASNACPNHILWGTVVYVLLVASAVTSMAFYGVYL